jgi:hypothetical protein
VNTESKVCRGIGVGTRKSNQHVSGFGGAYHRMSDYNRLAIREDQSSEWASIKITKTTSRINDQ